MFWFLIGIAVGLIVGWNLIPQPRWIKSRYDRISDRFWNWITGLMIPLVLLILPGCSIGGAGQVDLGYAVERAMAEIAIAAVTAESSPAPDAKPNVGDKCPDCNDPPGACGVGRVGDGRTCDRCYTCNGDGKIDERDVSQERPPPAPESKGKEVTLHMTASTRVGWPSKWYSEQRPKFEAKGWVVRVVLEPEQRSPVAYFDVVAPDGEVFQFYEFITLDDVYHLETR